MTTPASITTDRLHLEPWNLMHREALRAALDASEAHLVPWIPVGGLYGEDLRPTLERWMAQHRSGEACRFGLWRGSDLVGEVLLMTRQGPGRLEIGYWLHVAHTGQGYASEAVAAMLELAWAQADIEAVCFVCDARNTPSNRIPERLGATVEHVERVYTPEGFVALQR